MKITFISLGCDKNLVDTEMMLGQLSQEGFTFTDDEYEAEVIVINTCCFINDAKEESINTILEMAELKKQGTLKALVVTGCLAQRYKEEMAEEFKTLAERYEMKEEQVRKIVPVDELTLDLCVEKAIKLVRDSAKVTEITAEEAAAKEAAPMSFRSVDALFHRAPCHRKAS